MATTDTDTVTLVIGLSAGGAVVLTILGIWVKLRYDKNKKDNL